MSYYQWGVFGAVGVLVVLCGTFLYSDNGEHDSFFSFDIRDVTLPARGTGEAKVLADRQIVDFGTSENGVVAYSYLGAPIRDELAENEIAQMRTETSYTRYVETVQPGDDPIVKLDAVFYSQPAFAQDERGTWHRIEYATTTETAWRDRPASLYQRIAEVFIRTAYADTISPFSEAGDGYVHGTEGSGGTSVDSTATTMQVYSFCRTDVDGVAGLNRSRQGFVPFITSAIPAGATINSGSFNFYATSATDDFGSGTIKLVQTTQATHTTLATSDYEAMGTTPASDTTHVITGSITTSAYNAFTLNAAGRGFVKRSGEASTCSATSGITCLGIEETNDINNTPLFCDGFTPSTSYTMQVTLSTSENTGTSQDPYLSITYTIASSAIAQSGIKLGGGGGLKVTSGGLKMF